MRRARMLLVVAAASFALPHQSLAQEKQQKLASKEEKDMCYAVRKVLQHASAFTNMDLLKTAEPGAESGTWKPGVEIPEFTDCHVRQIRERGFGDRYSCQLKTKSPRAAEAKVRAVEAMVRPCLPDLRRRDASEPADRAFRVVYERDLSRHSVFVEVWYSPWPAIRDTVFMTVSQVKIRDGGK
jgi:hypothetical protein